MNSPRPADAAPPPAVAPAQVRLDGLLAEQRDLQGQMLDARSAGDGAVYGRLLVRRDCLPEEIDLARVDLLYARLAVGWPRAEAAIERETLARVERDVASAAYDALPHTQHASPAGVAALPLASGTLAQQAAERLEQARICQNYHRTRALHEEAEQAATAALFAIDELEDGVERATGQRPPAGEGIRMRPGVLGRNFVCTSPTGTTSTFQTGTVPPRWVAYQLRNRPTAWEPAPEQPPGHNLVDISASGLGHVSTHYTMPSGSEPTEEDRAKARSAENRMVGRGGWSRPT